MKKALKWGSIPVVILLLFALYVNFSPQKIYENKAPTLSVSIDSTKVAEGAKIATYLCMQCHLSDDGKLGGNLMEESELGKIYAPNITQHPQHGIADYTDGEIAYLLRTGIQKDGKYAPPWMIKLPHLADNEIENIIAFLRSDLPWVQPSDNVPPLTELSFLSKFLLKIGVIGPLPYPEAPVKAPDISNKVAYGKYLATAKYDCYGCHSEDFKTQNLMEPEKTPGYFGGGNPVLDRAGNVVLSANLTMDKATGIGNWTEEEFLKAVRTGMAPDNRMLRPPMIPYALLGEEEVHAIWAYLQTIPIIENMDLQKPLAYENK